MMSYKEAFELGEIMSETAKELGIYKIIIIKKKFCCNKVGFAVGWNLVME